MGMELRTQWTSNDRLYATIMAYLPLPHALSTDLAIFT